MNKAKQVLEAFSKSGINKVAPVNEALEDEDSNPTFDKALNNVIM